MGVNAVELLEDHWACHESIRWAKRQPDMSPQALWDTCTRPQWLVWWLRESLPWEQRTALERILAEHELEFPAFRDDWDGWSEDNLAEQWVCAAEGRRYWRSLSMDYALDCETLKRPRLLLARIRSEFPEPPGVPS